MVPLEKYQRQFLEQSRRTFHKTPLSTATEQAYLATMDMHSVVDAFRVRLTSVHEYARRLLANSAAT
jgi:hypothetical protein